MNAATLSGGRADRSMTPALRAARLLGWSSFGLAAAFLAAPSRIARAFGLEGKENLIRAYGGQEMLAGIGALSVDPAPAMWSRSGGDVIHIATLATGLSSEDPRQKRNAAIGLAALAGFLIVDTLVARRLSEERSRSAGEEADYSGRTGFPGGAEQARGVASDFETPPDLRNEPQQARVAPELETA